MDLAQLRQSLQDHGYGDDTATQQNGFINAAYREVHSQMRWPFLETINTGLSTVAGTASYTPPMTDWRNVDAIRLTWATDPTQNAPIEYLSPQDLFDKQARDQTPATPIYWTMYASQIWFYPIPDQVYQATIYYIKEPVDLSADGDIPLIPVAYHDVLVAGAITRIAFRQRDWIGLELWTSKYADGLSKLKEEYLVRQRQSSSQVKRSGWWDNYSPYPFTSTGF